MKAWCFGIGLLVVLTGKAQLGCVDEFLINQSVPCLNEYLPVCGCDNVTYRNDCQAIYFHGVVQFQQGPCELMDFAFFPNPPNPLTGTPLTIDIRIKEFAQSDVLIQIWSTMGFLYYTRQFFNISQGVIDNPDTRGWPTGVYYILVRAGSAVKIERLLINRGYD